MNTRSRRGGFTLVELLVALIILTAGMLAMVAAAGYSSITIRVAGTRTQRTAAVSSIAEQIRASAYNVATFNALANVDSAHGSVIGGYRVWYDVGAVTNGSRQITIYSSGPSYRPGTGWQLGVRETSTIGLMQPF